MHTLLREASRQSVLLRVGKLTPDTPARWGKFDAPRMLAHIVQSMRVMAGEVPMPDEKTPWVVRHFPLKQLLIFVLPFPKGLPTSRVLLARRSVEATSADAWEAEVSELERVLSEIGRKDPSGQWPSHAAFGQLTGREWGVLQYRHLDHHLKQFGC
jgi:hypothetical protein